MKPLDVSDFREQCLTLIENLPEGGVVITKRGKAVAKLIPVAAQADNSWMMGALKGRLKIKGDVLSSGVQWDAES